MGEDLLLLIISSPSGAGKTTLTRDLLVGFPSLTFSVSHTTRRPRATETDGRDYHFVERERFSELVVQQITGRYKVKNTVLRGLYVKVFKIASSLDSFSISYVPREHNYEADYLANQALDRP